MPKVRRKNLPQTLLNHLLDRVQERRISCNHTLTGHARAFCRLSSMFELGRRGLGFLKLVFRNLPQRPRAV